jgi:hypothetical protein
MSEMDDVILVLREIRDELRNLHQCFRNQDEPPNDLNLYDAARDVVRALERVADEYELRAPSDQT